MKQFFGAFFGSCLGILITGAVITAICIGLIVNAFSQAIKMDNHNGYKAKEKGMEFTQEN